MPSGDTQHMAIVIIIPPNSILFSQNCTTKAVHWGCVPVATGIVKPPVVLTAIPIGRDDQPSVVLLRLGNATMFAAVMVGLVAGGNCVR